MSPILEKINGVLRSKWYPFVMFGVVVALMIAYFIYAWMGYAPTTGPDQTDPWGPPRPGSSR